MSEELVPLTWPDGSFVELDAIRANTDAAQQVAECDPSDMIRTPDWVIGELQLVSHHAARMVVVIERAEAYKRRAATVLERARARARWENRAMPAAHLASHVVLVTADEKDDYDAAVIAFEYARRIGNLLKDYTGRVQSIGRLVESTYRTEIGGRT